MNHQDRIVYCWAICLVLGYYLWHSTQDSGDFYKLVDQKGGAYGELAQAFIHGHLYLSRAPDPLLAQSSNPYLPKYRLPGTTYCLDYSYYRDVDGVARYYLYFNPGPALIFYCPILALTGWMPSSFLIMFSIFLFNFALYAVLLRILVTRYFKNTPILLESILLVTYGFCNFGFYNLVTARMYEIAISSAATFALACFVCLLLALEPPYKRFWLLLAGISAALAMGCKVTNFFLCIVLLGTWLVIYFRQTKFNLRSSIVIGLLLFVPTGLCGLALMWYNDERFHNPFEFGLRYLVNEGDYSTYTFFKPVFIPESLLVYYFIPPDIVHHYPYILPYFEEHIVPTNPQEYIPYISCTARIHEDYVGVFPSFPICIMAALWYRNIRRIKNPLIRNTPYYFGLLLGVWWIIINLLFFSFYYMAVRYQIEMQTPTLLLTTLSLLALREVHGPFSTRMWTLLFSVALVGCFSAFCYGELFTLIYSGYFYY